jgi:hypothetical protein
MQVYLGYDFIMEFRSLELFDALTRFDLVVAENVLLEQHLSVVVQLLELFFGESRRSGFGWGDLGCFLHISVFSYV